MCSVLARLIKFLPEPKCIQPELNPNSTDPSCSTVHPWVLATAISLDQATAVPVPALCLRRGGVAMACIRSLVSQAAPRGQIGATLESLRQREDGLVCVLLTPLK